MNKKSAKLFLTLAAAITQAIQLIIQLTQNGREYPPDDDDTSQTATWVTGQLGKDILQDEDNYTYHQYRTILGETLWGVGGNGMEQKTSRALARVHQHKDMPLHGLGQNAHLRLPSLHGEQFQHILSK